MHEAVGESEGDDRMTDPAAGRSSKEPLTEAMACLIERANAGDESVSAELASFLDQHPEIWRQTGDLCWHATEAIIGLAAGKSLLGKESLKRKMDEMRAEVLEGSACPLLRLLAQ